MNFLKVYSFHDYSLIVEATSIDSNSKITILGNLLPMVAKGFCKKFIALLLASAAHATDSCPSREGANKSLI